MQKCEKSTVENIYIIISGREIPYGFNFTLISLERLICTDAKWPIGLVQELWS